MSNFSGVAQANAIAIPSVNTPANQQHGRVRVCWDEYTTVAPLPVALDTITFGGQLIPAGARIVNTHMITNGIGATTCTASLAVGSTAPIGTPLNFNAATIVYCDTFGEVLAAAAYPVLTFNVLTGVATAGRSVKVNIHYVID